MFIFFECAACLILVAIVVTLLFAVCALFIVLKEGAAILGATRARDCTWRPHSCGATDESLFETGLSAAGSGFRVNEYEEVSVSGRLPCSRC